MTDFTHIILIPQIYSGIWFRHIVFYSAAVMDLESSCKGDSPRRDFLFLSSFFVLPYRKRTQKHVNYLSNFPLPIVSSWDESSRAAEACQKLLPSQWSAHVICGSARFAQAPLLSLLCVSSLFPPITRLRFFPWQITAAGVPRNFEYINMWWNADEGSSSGTT